ncbi:MAG TPA: efflux RND transporter periplasmic adaptor subunit [Burkholderiaceae bacterium]|nr:efflux RND transporter periplasmic adaptor subunit [Rhodoferax sp.]HQX58458.1 efflux RND transporter periplasmic adaptor subunit [Burkholderiaceae bacterium]HQZ06674.1 efflux RND transporter periplasmic adaptor subunit [Burkholderiaceae bacterium]HRA62892.1 efflux RND transporter periplasmic adaptor subunit [Burkholderiaceae bacterium]
MKRSTWVATGFVILVALAAGGYGYWQQRSAKGVAAAEASSSAREAAGGSGAGNPARGASGAGAVGAPAVSVSIVKAVTRDQPVLLDATGTVVALNMVDVRPQVVGQIREVHVREGQFVQRGQLLFTLDDRNDQANVARARAQLTKDQAALADAQRQLKRSRELVAQQFLSQSALDSAQTLVASQQAVVGASQAALDATQLGLGYNRITAPASGRVGAINVYTGTLAQPTGAVLLTITQLDPIAVAFSLPQRYLGDALQALQGGHGEVQAQLSAGSEALTGKLQFVDSAVDSASGTVRVKAVFSNPHQTLWPGAYATVRMTVRTLADAIMVPQEAIITSQEGDTVYLAGADNKAVLRKIKVVYPAGTDAVVTGLNAGDPVIVDGRRNVRPGVPVVVRSADRATATKAARSGPKEKMASP